MPTCSTSLSKLESARKLRSGRLMPTCSTSLSKLESARKLFIRSQSLFSDRNCSSSRRRGRKESCDDPMHDPSCRDWLHTVGGADSGLVQGGETGRGAHSHARAGGGSGHAKQSSPEDRNVGSRKDRKRHRCRAHQGVSCGQHFRHLGLTALGVKIRV